MRETQTSSSRFFVRLMRERRKLCGKHHTLFFSHSSFGWIPSAFACPCTVASNRHDGHKTPTGTRSTDSQGGAKRSCGWRNRGWLMDREKPPGSIYCLEWVCTRNGYRKGGFARTRTYLRRRTLLNGTKCRMRTFRDSHGCPHSRKCVHVGGRMED